MACLSYQEDGTCKHFPDEKCPVQKSARDMFGDIETCEPVAKELEASK